MLIYITYLLSSYLSSFYKKVRFCRERSNMVRARVRVDTNLAVGAELAVVFAAVVATVVVAVVAAVVVVLGAKVVVVELALTVPCIMFRTVELFKTDSTLLVAGIEVLFLNTSSEETTTDPDVKLRTLERRNVFGNCAR